MQFVKHIVSRGAPATTVRPGRRAGGLAIVLMVAAFLLPTVSRAACQVTQPGGGMGTTPAQFEIPPTTIPINSNAPNGTLLATTTVTAEFVGGTSPQVICDGGIDSWDMTSPLPRASGYPSYFQTSIPGLAVTIQNSIYGMLPIFGDRTGTGYVSFRMDAITYTLRFYKVGPITQGGSLTGVVAERIFHAPLASSPGFVGLQLVGTGFIIKPSFPTCTVSTPDVIVSLDQKDASDFASVGSTVGEKDFNVSLACSGGDPASSTNLHMFLTDQTAQTNQTNVLSLTSSSTASGVGVQIVNGTTPVVFGQTLAAPTTDITRNIVVNTPTVDIPLKARYVRTGNITPGTLTAIATFTTTYN
ncbi:fimbrial protein [Lysobacter soli]|uniref:fimbrial protein n=1 Tax=Lysobacter soli TaxID=453783 RepID=UPI0037C9EDF5